MCSRGKDWWVHSPKIPVQSFKWASQTFYLNLQRFKWVMSHSGKKGFLFEDMWWDRRGFLWIQKGNNTTEVQNNTTLAKTWLFSRENGGGRGWLFQFVVSAVHRFSTSDLHHSVHLPILLSLLLNSRELPNSRALFSCPAFGFTSSKTAKLVRSRANVGGSGWSSWAVIGRWRPAGSWRQLRGRELPLASVSCSPFVNCRNRHSFYYMSPDVKINQENAPLTC